MAKKDEEFARLVAAHRRALLRYGLRRVDDRFAAEEVVAETYVVAWRRWGAKPDPDEEIFWLYGIARGVVSNVRRSQSRSLRLEGRLAFEREGEQESPRYGEEDVEQLMRALGALSPNEQELLQFAYWEKLSYREIGLVLDCSEKAVGIRLSRARQKLRHWLNESSSGITALPTLKEEKQP